MKSQGVAIQMRIRKIFLFEFSIGFESGCFSEMGFPGGSKRCNSH